MDEAIEVEDLDDLVKTRFKEVLDSVRPEKKQFIHPKSVRNFIYHLVDKPKLKSKKKKKIDSQILKESEIKQQLLKYLEVLLVIDLTELNHTKSKELWDEYLEEISEFMTKYYRFSKRGGCCLIIGLLIIIGVPVDALLIMNDITNFPYFSLYILAFSIIEYRIQVKLKRIYRCFY